MERASASLLLRCWLEPSRGSEPEVRGYLRDLRTGEEIPFSGLRAVTEQVLRQLGVPAASEHVARRRESGA